MMTHHLLVRVLICSLAMSAAQWSYGQMRDPTEPQALPSGAFHGYMLTAIMTSGNKKLAVINDHIVHIGDLVANAKVTAINDNTVELDSPSGRLTLTLMISPLIPVGNTVPK